MCAEDRCNRPASRDHVGSSFQMRGNVPYGCNRHAVTDVEVGIAAIQPRIQWVEQPQVLLAVKIRGERAAAIVYAVRPGVIGAKRETLPPEVSQLETGIQAVVKRVASVGAEVDERILFVEARRCGTGACIHDLGAA